MTDTAHLFLARHGRTALNAADRLRGLANPPLDPVGLAEAERLGRALAATGITVVVSSPLDRAVSTAEHIARAAGIPHRIDDRLNDRDYGPWTGRIRAEVLAQWGSIDAAPGVEPLDDVLGRVLPALDDISAQDDRAAIVTHDAVIRPVILHIDPSRTPLRIPTGSWNTLERTTIGWSVRSGDTLPDS